jgi:signal transduction histidine kinase
MNEHRSPNTEPKQVKPYIVTRELLPVIALVIGFALVTGVLLHHSAKQHNVVAEQAAQHLARSSIMVLRNTLTKFVSDYAYWNDTAQNTIEDFNEEWVSDYIEIWAIDGLEMDGVLAVGQKNRVIAHAQRNGTQTLSAPDLFPAGLTKLIDAARAQPQTLGEVNPAISGFFNDGHGLYLASAAVIMWEDERGAALDQGMPGVLIFFKSMDGPVLKEIETQFLLKGLELITDTSPATMNQLPLKAVDGATLGKLQWRVQEAGTNMLRNLIVPMIVISVLMLCTVGYIIWRTLRAARLVENYHKWLESQTEELLQARNLAEAANRSKSQFLATMSHELRTPLNAIIGFSDFIRDPPHQSLNSEKTKDYANDIYNSGQYLLTLINDILDMSKIESKRFELFEEVVPLDQLIEQCLKLTSRAADEKSISMRWTETSISILCDTRAMKQILINLVTNAIKFSHPQTRIKIDVHQEEEDFVISIQDNGIGMTDEDLERALLPFGQVRDAHIRENQGTGLGLNISRALTELHGGKLTIASQYEKGTTVSIHLPNYRIVPVQNASEIGTPDGGM